jgi:hypothetical protein
LFAGFSFKKIPSDIVLKLACEGGKDQMRKYGCNLDNRVVTLQLVSSGENQYNHRR